MFWGQNRYQSLRKTVSDTCAIRGQVFGVALLIAYVKVQNTHPSEPYNRIINLGRYQTSFVIAYCDKIHVKAGFTISRSAVGSFIVVEMLGGR